MSLSKVIELARTDLGYTEDPPGSNRVKYWDAYDPKMQGQPWCVAFLWWVFQQAGERMAFFGGGKTASCSMLLRWYREQGLVVPTQQARAGDIGIYNFSGTQEPQHCGLITDVKRAISTIASLTSIEGNTTLSGGAEDNGGIVAEKTRFTKNVVAVCRPQYAAEELVKDYTGRWSEAFIEAAKADGVLTGYPDGSFRPTQAVTREELAAFYYKMKESKKT